MTGAQHVASLRSEVLRLAEATELAGLDEAIPE
jgi:hypothetical protein